MTCKSLQCQLILRKLKSCNKALSSYRKRRRPNKEDVYRRELQSEYTRGFIDGRKREESIFKARVKALENTIIDAGLRLPEKPEKRKRGD